MWEAFAQFYMAFYGLTLEVTQQLNIGMKSSDLTDKL